MELAFGEELRHRLGRECSSHERTIREITLACAAGELEPELALRRCALELHSLKGVVSMLGLTPVVSAIGNLCDVMLAAGAQAEPPFWEAFQPWSASLLAYVRAAADGRHEPSTLEALVQGREILLKLLISAAAVGDGLGPSAGAQRSRTPSFGKRSLTPSAGRRLLIIDDSATVRAVLSVRLGERGYPVRAARSIHEGAVALLEFNPEIVITDVHMPDVEGDEVCRRIKVNMKHLVPVIFYSSLPEHELKRRAQAAGADAYVCKDQGIDGLIARMDELLSDEILF